MSVMVVTGFVPLPGHPRPVEEYSALGQELLRGVDAPSMAFGEGVADCWLSRLCDGLRRTPPHSEGDNPAKNTLAYHAVQHQKFEWIRRARDQNPEREVLVWIDYGILHVPGITVAVINNFLHKLETNACINAPGCWNATPPEISDEFPCWRFCGGLIIVPRREAGALANAVQIDVHKRLHEGYPVSWEVNTLARVEKSGRVPFSWYPADHDASMFNNY